MLTTDALERERYESREKAIHDQVSLLEGALKQGRAEGDLIGRIQTLQQILKRPITPQDELSRAPIEELRRLADGLASESAGR